MSRSRGGSRTCSSAAGRTSIRGRGKSSCTPTPMLLDVQVIGVPDERYGEEVMAWVKLRPGVPSLTAGDVRRFATGHLAHYKIPRYIRVVDDFPMTISGKVRKVEMRAVSVELLGLRGAGAEPGR